MPKNSTVRVLGLIVLVVLAGCAGGSGGGPAGDGENGAGDGVDATPGDGDGASADWCVRGQTSRFTNPETGERVSMEVKGVVERDGRQVCRAVWETNQGDVRRIEMLYAEDGSYRKMISYDADGEVVNEFEMTGGTASDGDGGSASGGDGADASAAWCTDQGSMAFANPQTGEQVSMEVQGIVERDGREVCKAVWETNQGDVRRIEMFFTEDRSYQVMVMYDAEGNVVNEVQMSGSSG